MPWMCCVPLCKSNYDSEKNRVTTFRFPSDVGRRLLWLFKIQRRHFIPSPRSCVCIKHFEERFLITERRFRRDDGSILVVPRRVPVLTKDAYPTIFNYKSVYWSAIVPNDHESPRSTSKESQIESDENVEHLQDDKIEDISQFKLQYQSKLPSNWLTLSTDGVICLAKVHLDSIPELLVSMKIKRDLYFEVWFRNIPLSPDHFQWLFGPKLQLESWAKFECLISHLNGYSKDTFIDMQLKGISDTLEECVENCTDSNKQNKLLIVSEQLKLLSGHSVSRPLARSRVLPKARKSITRRKV